MAKYDRKRLTGDIERKRRTLSSLSDDQLKKEVEHTHKLLEFSLPTCLRKRTESIVSSRAPGKIETELERFTYETYWLQLLIDYEKQVKEETERRKIA
ncbi:MAG: hypothetical protein C4520_01830 [Candidatus Abyssobacteria bacterium SURF_5]|uniref:Uncharacterized protein n=1 Tax=Abyssobacteria bacterium (strain SURF_5) TaxID=2093360 RepID=A0A3A4P4P8_ABYX5|nr:MAG: hypothetical protein C4520_01830 [Candidatus Abyssubacteria bacterium SURF_5]